MTHVGTAGAGGMADTGDRDGDGDGEDVDGAVALAGLAVPAAALDGVEAPELAVTVDSCGDAPSTASATAATSGSATDVAMVLVDEQEEEEVGATQGRAT